MTPPSAAAAKAAPQQRQQSNQQALAKVTPTQALAKLIEDKQGAFARVAGEHFDASRLVKLAQAALSRSPQLAKCTPASVLVSLMRCAELGLEPDGALPQFRMWLVPRWNGRIKALECTYLMDYRAQIQKARDSKLVTSFLAKAVRKGDRFNVRYDADGTSIAKFEYVEGGEGGVFSDRGPIVGYFTAARFEGGEVQLVTMSHRDALAFRDRYAPRKKDGSPGGGPWWNTKDGSDDQFDEMALKTCLRKLWKLLPAGGSEARRLHEQMDREGAVEEGGRPVTSTAPVDVELGVPMETEEGEGGDTASEVEHALAGAGQGEREDIPFETAGEEAARKEREGKATATPQQQDDDFR